MLSNVEKKNNRKPAADTFCGFCLLTDRNVQTNKPNSGVLNIQYHYTIFATDGELCALVCLSLVVSVNSKITCLSHLWD